MSVTLIIRDRDGAMASEVVCTCHCARHVAILPANKLVIWESNRQE